jgi:uncharacterized protein
MLCIDLADVRAGAVETPGFIEASDPLWGGFGLALVGSLSVRGRFSSAGEGTYFWHARVKASFHFECRRCLNPVDVPFDEDLELLFVEEERALEDDVGCYVIPGAMPVLDLREALREELHLAVPQFVECRPDCRGLCPRCGANLNAGPCACRPQRDPRWQALSNLLPGRPTED